MKKFTWWDNTLIAAGVIAAILLFAFLAWVVPSYFEARAYNNTTGANVSTFDAMFIELRVQSGPMNKGKG